MNTTSKTLLGKRGIIFTLDAGISFTITLVTVLIFVIFLTQNGLGGEKEIKEFELEEKAILIADSLVKNFDENNTLLGSCILDWDKKRVKTNELSETNLQKAAPINLSGIFVESISYKTSGLEKLILLEKKESTECLSVKRFVLIDGEKGVLEVKTCREN